MTLFPTNLPLYNLNIFNLKSCFKSSASLLYNNIPNNFTVLNTNFTMGLFQGKTTTKKY